jgi:hypothetical protein
LLRARSAFCCAAKLSASLAIASRRLLSSCIRALS